MSMDQFFLLFAVILIAARVFSETAARFGIPTVIGELAVALLLAIALTTLLPPLLLKAFYSHFRCLERIATASAALTHERMPCDRWNKG